MRVQNRREGGSSPFECLKMELLGVKVPSKQRIFSKNIPQLFYEYIKLLKLYSITVFNGWHKYDNRVMYKKYIASLPLYGMWGSRKTS